MRHLLERLEGIYLLAGGVLMILVARGEAYLSFMNPRFRPLTIGAGGVLILLGLLLSLRPRHEHHWSRLLAFIPFLALFLFSLHEKGTSPSRIGPDVPAVTAGQVMPAPRSPPAAETAAAGFSPQSPGYSPQPIPITCGELYNLANQAEPVQLQQRYVLRGVAVRPPSLQSSNQVLCLRTFVYCCAVDATAVGFLIPFGDANAPRDGQWIRVTGRLQPRPEADVEDYSAVAKLPGAYFAAVHDAYMLVAESWEPAEPPEVEFTFSLNEQPPYGY